MSIALVVTRGFGNSTFNGSLAEIVLAGYSIGEEPEPVPEVAITRKLRMIFAAEDRDLFMAREDRNMIVPPENRSLI